MAKFVQMQLLAHETEQLHRGHPPTRVASIIALDNEGKIWFRSYDVSGKTEENAPPLFPWFELPLPYEPTPGIP